jgi:hypothetical protein
MHILVIFIKRKLIPPQFWDSRKNLGTGSDIFSSM